MLGSANDKAWGEKKMTELESLINAYHAKGGSFGE